MIKRNEGFSLIEVIVVLAISSIFLIMASVMIINSSRLFNRESGKIDLQNESQLIVNNLNEAFMEATKLEITHSAGDILVDLGSYVTPDEVLADPSLTAYSSKGKAYCRRLYYRQSSQFLALIVNSSYLDVSTMTMADLNAAAPGGAAPQEQLDGYRLSVWIKEFDVTIDDSCKSTATNATTGITEPVVVNPVKVKVTYKLTDGTTENDYEISIKLRNYLDQVIVDGTTTKVIDKHTYVEVAP